MSNFGDRLVVVTGGTGFLGQAVVERLLRGGAQIAVPAIHEADLRHFVHAGDARVRVVMGVDLADPAQALDFYRRHAEGLWASVHVAGGFAVGPIAQADPGVFEAQFRLNALTCYNCCRAAVIMMREAGLGGGRIVNVAAMPALHHASGANMVAYAASKAAVAAITGALAEEVKHDGIWVNAVVPSIMDTPANRKAMPHADHSAWPKVEEVAETMVFLASPQNMVSRAGLMPVCGRS
jgi:NAD(P)-dependent dehydrogenase (short-subunit alcohol dehydrogenase family)